ncbi:hypothetical protein ACLB2K_072957 [Fragaria x ananassa]
MTTKKGIAAANRIDEARSCSGESKAEARRHNAKSNGISLNSCLRFMLQSQWKSQFTNTMTIYKSCSSFIKTIQKYLKNNTKRLVRQCSWTDKVFFENLQDEMMDLMDVSNEIQETLGRSYSVPDDIDEEELMGELDALEADMGMETKSDGVPSYLQPDRESDIDGELNLPSAPIGQQFQLEEPMARLRMNWVLPAVPRATLRGYEYD